MTPELEPALTNPPDTSNRDRATGLIQWCVAWVRRTVLPRRVLFVTAGIGLALVAVLTVAGGVVYDAVAEDDGVSGLDRPVLEEAIRLRNPTVDTALTWFTHLGGPLGMTIIALAITVAIVWRLRRRTPLVVMVLGVAGSLVLTIVGKNLFNRQRPPLADAVPPYESSPSFPSGHSLNSTVIAGLVAYLVIRELVRLLARILVAVAAAAWALAMGASRVFLGHHWLTDVMFGWLVGLAWLAVMITGHRLYLSVRGPHAEHAPDEAVSIPDGRSRPSTPAS